MSYRLEFSKKASRELKKLDRFVAKMIVNWLRTHIDNCENPRSVGKALTGTLREYWRYRIGTYRAICDIQDDKLVVLAISSGDHKDISGK
jgi:mRNA interferase RelE/StbE